MDDIFGFYIFGSLPVSTYSTTYARIYVFDDQYHIIRKNLQVASGFYEINETGTFFDKSFFLNMSEKDGIVRFVFEHEDTTIGIEILEREYESFKTLLLEGSA